MPFIHRYNKLFKIKYSKTYQEFNKCFYVRYWKHASLAKQYMLLNNVSFLWIYYNNIDSISCDNRLIHNCI
jgi:hypothetical protein